MDETRLYDELSKFAELFKAYEALLGYAKRLCMSNDRLAGALCEFYATWGASKIIVGIGSTIVFDLALCRKNGDRFPAIETLPNYGTVQTAAQNAVTASVLKDNTALVDALNEMDVFAFCPTLEQVFPRMEQIASRVRGKARQVFLVDLSLYATEVGDFERAERYIQEARTFHPTSRELYHLLMVEGVIAFNDGRIKYALQCLENSAKACQADLDSSVQCSLLPPYLLLAEKLLQCGHRVAVLCHLLDCHNVWQSFRPQFEEWISIIENGGTPILQVEGIWGTAEQPSYRLHIQWMRAIRFGMQTIADKPRLPMSPAHVLAERESLRVETERDLDAKIRKELAYLEKGLSASQDQSPSNPEEPRQSD